MRIVEQARLWFHEGKSDKVYEVDLVEVAAGQHVVNFRYGRRGSALKEGTKTPVPVSLDKARAVFASLVAEKTKGGYAPLSDAPPIASLPAPRPGAARSRTQREARTRQALLDALAQGNRATQPVHLTLRKVGERSLREAEPLLLELLAAGRPPQGMLPAAFRHLVIAALARCGSSSALAPLTAIAEDAKAPLHVRNIARLARTMIGGSNEQSRVLSQVPSALRPGFNSDEAAMIVEAERLLADRPSEGRAAIFGLYLAGPASAEEVGATAHGLTARRIVIAMVRVARLAGEELGLLRTLSWAAELRRDGELFALLARRFETGSRSAPQATLGYFRRRAARVLRRLGAIESPDYTRAASELLLQYRDAHAEPVRTRGQKRWDTFAGYHALNFVLYEKSPRYHKAGHRRATWSCRGRYVPGGSVPRQREEAYPQLWDRAPEQLWRVATSPAATVCITFATRALRAQTSFLGQLSDAALADAMAGGHALTRQLAFDVAHARPLNVLLARGALASGIEQAEGWVLTWLENDAQLLAADAELLTLLITASSARARETAARLTRGRSFAPTYARAVVEQTIATLLALPLGPLAQGRAGSAATFLLQSLADALTGLSWQVLRDLLAHPVAAVAELGAELVLRRARTGPLEGALLDVLLGSPHATVRSTGARILAETPPGLMKDEPTLLVHFALSANAELRQGTRGLLGDVARLYPEVGRLIAAQLIDALLRPQPDGAPAHVVTLLRYELHGCLSVREPGQVLALVAALSPHARQAGGLLLPQLSADELGLDVIVRLASHELLLVRQGAWALAQAARERWVVAPVALAHLCDAGWEDSRAFAFELVRSFPAAVLVPDAVLAICDSVRPDVQAFGQSLLLEHWQDQHAGLYLLRLSEHPSTNIQLLVSGLLARHAHGDLERLRELIPYLQTVLSQVNRGGVAKQRVLEFLRREAAESAAAAALLAPLLERQSLTRAISHKAPLIATMVRLHARHPEVPLPIVVIEPALHSTLARAAARVEPRSSRGV